MPKVQEQTQALKAKLNQALIYVRNTCVFGSVNRTEDFIRTGGYLLELYNRQKVEYLYTKDKVPPKQGLVCFRYDYVTKRVEKYERKWTMKVCADKNTELFGVNGPGPLFDDKCPLNNNQKVLLGKAIIAIRTRTANCGVMSNLVAKYLWERCDGIEQIEVIGFKNIDHTFVIINRQGDFNDPSSWGENSWIVDPWLNGGEIYPAKEILANIKKLLGFIHEQYEKFTEMGLNIENFSNVMKKNEIIMDIIARINPKSDVYPTYGDSPVKSPIEDYYQCDGEFTVDNQDHRIMREAEQNHREQFQDCLKLINKPKP
jgi:hypothetical protein